MVLTLVFSGKIFKFAMKVCQFKALLKLKNLPLGSLTWMLAALISSLAFGQMNFSTTHYMALLSPKARDPRERKCFGWKLQVLYKLISEVTCHHFCYTPLPHRLTLV